MAYDCERFKNSLKHSRAQICELSAKVYEAFAGNTTDQLQKGRRKSIKSIGFAARQSGSMIWIDQLSETRTTFASR